MVTGCIELDWPAAITGKVICDGFAAKPVANCPAPFSGTETAETPEVEEETASVAEMEPVADGVKTICAVQLLPLASDEPQVEEVTE